MSATVEQRTGALDRAHEARIAAKRFKASLAGLPPRQAVLEAARVLVEERELVGAMRVYKLLEAVPTIGVATAKAILVRHQIYAAKPVRDLTHRQAHVLAGALVRHAARMGKT